MDMQKRSRECVMQADRSLEISMVLDAVSAAAAKYTTDVCALEIARTLAGWLRDDVDDPLSEVEDSIRRRVEMGMPVYGDGDDMLRAIATAWALAVDWP
jgi:hypothetical protein